jgi:hypothetical protein
LNVLVGHEGRSDHYHRDGAGVGHADGRRFAVKITMMLADHVAAAGSKLYINGGGWSITGPGPTPGAIAMDVKVPWDQREREHKFRLELVDADGQPVLVPTPLGVEPLFVETTLQLQGPYEGVKPGTTIDVPVPINYPPIPLAPGARYEWRLTVNGESDEDWRLPFSTRAVIVEEAEAA